MKHLYNILQVVLPSQRTCLGTLRVYDNLYTPSMRVPFSPHDEEAESFFISMFGKEEDAAS